MVWYSVLTSYTPTARRLPARSVGETLEEGPDLQSGRQVPLAQLSQC